MKRAAILSCIAIILFTTQVLAADVTMEDLMKEIKSLKTRVAELEGKLAQQGRELKKQDAELVKQEVDIKKNTAGLACYRPGKGLSIGDAGLNITAAATFVEQYAIDPPGTGEEDDVLDATYSIDIGIEKEFDDWGKGFIHLEAGDGGGLDGDEVVTFSGVNRDDADTDNRVEVTEVWYEHYLFDHQLALLGGKLDPTVMLDHNAIANCEASQFLSHTFRNSTAVEFPDDNTYGFRALATPSSYEWLEVEGGIFDDNADWEDIDEDLFSYAQVNIKPNLIGREGNYRSYFWFDDSKHTKWADAGTDTQVNFGFGTSIDQKILDYATIFGRFGWQDPDVSTVEWAWSGGL